MRALQLLRLYALAVLALVMLGGMVLRPGRPAAQADRSPAPPAERSPAPPAERVASI